jgi:hypothetical protein
VITNKERYERLFERFDMPEPAMDRLLDLRERKRRNQRIASGAAAVLVTALVAVGVILAAVDRSPQPLETPSPTPSGTQATPGAVATPGKALWPQRTASELETAQAAADAGDPAFRWQTQERSGTNVDGQQVAIAFIQEELGWENWDVWNGNCAPGISPGGNTCPTIWTLVRGQEAVHILVAQPAREGVGGIWAVVGWRPTEFTRGPDPKWGEYGSMIQDYFGPSCPGTRWGYPCQTS